MLLPSMLETLFSICVFAAFQLTTVESYTCTKCLQDECTSSAPDTCEATEGCFNTRQEFMTSGSLTAWSQKGCSSGTCTALSFSATLGDKHTFGYDHQCCQAEQCNKNDLTLSQDSKPNGIECPACYIEDSPTCVSAPLQCTGAETKCVEVTGTNTLDSHTLFGMGCATESACDLDMVVVNSVKIRTKCQAANSGSLALAPVASATLTSLFLLQVLL